MFKNLVLYSKLKYIFKSCSLIYLGKGVLRCGKCKVFVAQIKDLLGKALHVLSA